MQQVAEAPRKTSINRAPAEPQATTEESKLVKGDRNRTRSGSTAEYASGKKKSPMQKTYLEDA